MLIQNLTRRSLLRSPTKLLGSHRSSLGLATKSYLCATSRSLSTSPWTQFELAPVDPIVGLNEIFQNDDYPSKVIVGVGAYRDDVSRKMFSLRV